MSRGKVMIDHLVLEMERKLQSPQNLRKGQWDHDHPHALFVRLCEEIKELRDELETVFSNCVNTRHLITNEEYNAILSECADVANFAGMIADVCRRRIDHS